MIDFGLIVDKNTLINDLGIPFLILFSFSLARKSVINSSWGFFSTPTNL